MEIIHVDENNFDEVVRNSHGRVMVDFFATWCPPCKMLAPILEEIASSDNSFQICKLDIDQAMSLADEFGVMSVPTMILFENGQELDRIIGFHSKNDVLAFAKK